MSACGWDSFAPAIRKSFLEWDQIWMAMENINKISFHDRRNWAEAKTKLKNLPIFSRRWVRWSIPLMHCDHIAIVWTCHRDTSFCLFFYCLRPPERDVSWHWARDKTRHTQTPCVVCGRKSDTLSALMAADQTHRRICNKLIYWCNLCENAIYPSCVVRHSLAVAHDGTHSLTHRTNVCVAGTRRIWFLIVSRLANDYYITFNAGDWVRMRLSDRNQAEKKNLNNNISDEIALLEDENVRSHEGGFARSIRKMDR